MNQQLDLGDRRCSRPDRGFRGGLPGAGRRISGRARAPGGNSRPFERRRRCLQPHMFFRAERLIATPVDGEYWYEKAIEAGSDHALRWIAFTS